MLVDDKPFWPTMFRTKSFTVESSAAEAADSNAVDTGGRFDLIEGFKSATVIYGGKPGEGCSRLLMLTLGSLFRVLLSPTTSISSSILNMIER